MCAIHSDISGPRSSLIAPLRNPKHIVAGGQRGLSSAGELDDAVSINENQHRTQQPFRFRLRREDLSANTNNSSPVRGDAQLVAPVAVGIAWTINTEHENGGGRTG